MSAFYPSVRPPNRLEQQLMSGSVPVLALVLELELELELELKYGLVPELVPTQNSGPQPQPFPALGLRYSRLLRRRSGSQVEEHGIRLCPLQSRASHQKAPTG